MCQAQGTTGEKRAMDRSFTCAAISRGVDQLKIRAQAQILAKMEEIDRSFTCAALCTRADQLEIGAKGLILGIHYLRLSA